MKSLQSAIEEHVAQEVVSFHTPGHKGRFSADIVESGEKSTNITQSENAYQLRNVLQSDLTELPGLDDLSDPAGVLKNLERRAAELWQAASSLISVNGASAGIVAAMLSLAARGSFVLVPRNAHRSVVNGLVLSGLTPIWYEPIWDEKWQTWSSVNVKTMAESLAHAGTDLAGVVAVSPTYGGALSDIPAISALCHERGVPLIVDEAHGAHFIPGSGMPPSAVAGGADIVVHSLHKTLSALTQTGVVHIGKGSLITEDHFRACLRLVQTTSPSYVLLASIERAIDEISGDSGRKALADLQDLALRLDSDLSRIEGLSTFSTEYGTDHLHLLVASDQMSPQRLNQYLSECGIFAEAIIGSGVLLLLGLGSRTIHGKILLQSLRNLVDQSAGLDHDDKLAQSSQCSSYRFEIDQVMTPRAASLAPSLLVPIENATDAIAAECIAPCPPGVPICVPGQRLTKDVLHQIPVKQIRIVDEGANRCVHANSISATEISNGNNSSC